VAEALGLFHVLQRLSDMKFDSVDFVLDSNVVTNGLWNLVKWSQLVGVSLLHILQTFRSSLTDDKQMRWLTLLLRVVTLSASSTIYSNAICCIHLLLL